MEVQCVDIKIICIISGFHHSCLESGAGEKAKLEVASSVAHVAICFREMLKWRSCVTLPV